MDFSVDENSASYRPRIQGHYYLRPLLQVVEPTAHLLSYDPLAMGFIPVIEPFALLLAPNELQKFGISDRLLGKLLLPSQSYVCGVQASLIHADLCAIKRH